MQLRERAQARFNVGKRGRERGAAMGIRSAFIEDALPLQFKRLTLALEVRGRRLPGDFRRICYRSFVIGDLFFHRFAFPTSSHISMLPPNRTVAAADSHTSQEIL